MNLFYLSFYVKRVFQWSGMGTSEDLWKLTFYYPISFNSSYYAGSIIDFQNTNDISVFNPLIFTISNPNTSSVSISARRVKSIINNTSIRGNGIFGLLFIIGY